MLKVIKGVLFWAAYLMTCLVAGYGIAWLYFDAPEKVREIKNRKYIELELGNDEDEFDF